MDKRWQQTQQEHVKLLDRLDIPDFNTSFLDEVPPVVMGTAFSGGGYRSMLTGAGAVAAMDSRVNGSLDLGALGGLFQAMSYLVGLSSGSWLLTSLFLNENVTVPDLQGAPNLWSLDKPFWGGERMRDVQPGNPVLNPGEIDHNGTDLINGTIASRPGFRSRFNSLTKLRPRGLTDSLSKHLSNRPKTGMSDLVQGGRREGLRRVGGAIRNRPSTGISDRFKNRPSTGVSDRLKNRPVTGISDRFKKRPSTGISDRVRNRPNTGISDRFKKRPKTGISHEINNGLSKLNPLIPDARKVVGGLKPTRPPMRDFFKLGHRQSDLEKLLEFITPDFLCEKDFSEFLKYLDPLYTYRKLEAEVKETIYYFMMIKEEVDLKSAAGFVTTLTDYWGRALARQLLPDSRGGQGTTWSDVQTMAQFVNYSMPFPIMVAVGREPSESNSTYMISPLWSTLFEMTPFEFGSWNPSLNAFSDTRYLGSTLYNGTPADNVTLAPLPSTEPACVLGFDNAGFLAGTSSSVFNDPFEDMGIDQDYIRELFTGIIDAFNNLNTSFWGDIFSPTNQTLPETDLTWQDADYAIYSPNPFMGFETNASTDKFFEAEHLFLADGGEDGQLVPLEPLLQEHRNVDVIFAIDASSNTEDNFPDGTALRMSQERFLSEDSEQAAGINFPQLAAEFGNDPVFLGCFINTSYATIPKSRKHTYSYRRENTSIPENIAPIYPPPPPPFQFPNNSYVHPNVTFQQWRGFQTPYRNGTLANDTSPFEGILPINSTLPINGTRPVNSTLPVNGTLPPNEPLTVDVSVDKYPPLIVYVPNSYQSYWTGDSTYQVEYSTEDVAGYITNGYDLMTRKNSTSDPDWAKCVGCATVLRAWQGTNATIPDFCMGCFGRYCV